MHTNGSSIASDSKNQVKAAENKESVLHSYETTVHFKTRPKDIKIIQGNLGERCIDSSEFQLNEMTWHIMLCHKIEEGTKSDENNEKEKKDYALIKLMGHFDGDTAAWSCEAETEFTLMGKDIKGKIGKATFSKANALKDSGKIADWQELPDGATFEFKIKTGNLNRTPVLDHIFTKFEVRVKHLSKLDKDKEQRYSDAVLMRGLKWKVLVMKVNEFLGAYITADEDDMPIDTSWKVNAKFTAMKKDGAGESKEFKEIDFNWSVTAWGHGNLIKWDDLMKAENGYVLNDSVLLAIELNVGEPTKTK